MPALTIPAYIDYFKAKATAIKAINYLEDATKPSFVDESEFFHKMENGLKYPCLHVEYPDINPTNNGAENYRDVMQCAFTVWVKYDTKKHSATYPLALQKSRDIARTILAQMRKDDADISSTIANMFDIENVQPLQNVTQEAMGITGYRVLFNLDTHINLAVNSSELI